MTGVFSQMIAKAREFSDLMTEGGTISDDRDFLIARLRAERLQLKAQIVNLESAVKGMGAGWANDQRQMEAQAQEIADLRDKLTQPGYALALRVDELNARIDAALARCTGGE